MDFRYWFLFYIFVSKVFGDCFPECVETQGTCFGDTCVCTYLYEGPTCSETWKDNYPNWWYYFLTYVGITAFMSLSLGIFAFVQLVLIFKSRKEKRFFTVITYILFGVLLACTIRLIQFLIHPNTLEHKELHAVDGILWIIPLLIIFDSVFLFLLYWIEVILSTKVREVYFVKKLRPVLIAFIVITAVVIIPLATAHALTSASKYTFYPFAAVSAILVIFIAFIAIYYGTKILKIMKKLWAITDDKHMEFFVKKMTRGLFAGVVCLIAALLTAPWIVIYGRKPWQYITIHLFLEIEFHAVLLYLVQKEKPGASVSRDTSITDGVELPAHPESESASQ